MSTVCSFRSFTAVEDSGSSMIVLQDTKAEFDQCHVESSQKGGTLFKTQGLSGFKLNQCSVIFANAAKMQLDVPEIAMFLCNFTALVAAGN